MKEEYSYGFDNNPLRGCAFGVGIACLIGLVRWVAHLPWAAWWHWLMPW